MDNALQLFVNLQFIIACLSISAFTFICKSIIEFFLDQPAVPASKSSKFWTKLFLPILPVVVGGLCGYFFTSYPYPTGMDGVGGRISFGLVCGLFSGFAYRIAKGMLAKQIPADATPVQSDK